MRDCALCVSGSEKEIEWEGHIVGVERHDLQVRMMMLRRELKTKI